MSTAGLLVNPDARPLPAGWSEHFDQRRGIWFYQLNTNPPRISYAHPSGPTPIPRQAQYHNQQPNLNFAHPGPNNAYVHQQPSSPPLRSSTSTSQSTGGKMSFAQMLYASAAVPAPATTITNVTQNENRNQGRNHSSQAQNRNQQTESSYLPTPISRGVTPVSMAPSVSNSSVSSGSGRNNGVYDYNHERTHVRGGREYGYSETSYDAQGGYDEGYDDDDAYGGMRDVARGVTPAPVSAPVPSPASVGGARSAKMSTRESGPRGYVSANTQDVGDGYGQAGRVGLGREDEEQRSGGAHANYADPPIEPYSYSAPASASASVSESASPMASSFDVERKREQALARLERGSAGTDTGTDVRSANTNTGQADFMASPTNEYDFNRVRDNEGYDVPPQEPHPSFSARSGSNFSSPGHGPAPSSTQSRGETLSYGQQTLDESRVGNGGYSSPPAEPQFSVPGAELGRRGSVLPVYALTSDADEQQRLLEPTSGQVINAHGREEVTCQGHGHEQDVPQYSKYELRQDDTHTSGTLPTPVSPPTFQEARAGGNTDNVTSSISPNESEVNDAYPFPNPTSNLSQTGPLSFKNSSRTRIQRNVSGPRMPSSGASRSSSESYHALPQIPTSPPPPAFLPAQSESKNERREESSPVYAQLLTPLSPPTCSVPSDGQGMTGAGSEAGRSSSTERELLGRFDALKLDMHGSDSSRSAQQPGVQQQQHQNASMARTTSNATPPPMSFHTSANPSRHSKPSGARTQSTPAPTANSNTTRPLSSAERRHQLRRERELSQDVPPVPALPALPNPNVQQLTGSIASVNSSPTVNVNLNNANALGFYYNVPSSASGSVNASTTTRPALSGPRVAPTTGRVGSRGSAYGLGQGVMSVERTGAGSAPGLSLGSMGQETMQAPQLYAQMTGQVGVGMAQGHGQEQGQGWVTSPTTISPTSIPTQSLYQPQHGTFTHSPHTQLSGPPPLHPLRPNITGTYLPDAYQMQPQTPTTANSKPPKTLKQRLTKLSARTMSSLSNMKLPSQLTLSPSLRTDIARLRKSPLLRKAVMGSTAVAGMTGALVVNTMTAGMTSSVLRRDAVLRMAAAVGDLVAGKDEGAVGSPVAAGNVDPNATVADAMAGIVLDSISGVIVDTATGVYYDPSTSQFCDSSGGVFDMEALLSVSSGMGDDYAVGGASATGGDMEGAVIQAAVGVLGNLAGAIVANVQQQQTQQQLGQMQTPMQTQTPLQSQFTNAQLGQTQHAFNPLAQIGQQQPLYPQMTGSSSTSAQPQVVQPQVTGPSLPPKQSWQSLPATPSPQAQLQPQSQIYPPGQLQAQAQMSPGLVTGDGQNVHMGQVVQRPPLLGSPSAQGQTQSPLQASPASLHSSHLPSPGITAGNGQNAQMGQTFARPPLLEQSFLQGQGQGLVQGSPAPTHISSPSPAPSAASMGSGPGPGPGSGQSLPMGQQIQRPPLYASPSNQNQIPLRPQTSLQSHLPSQGPVPGQYAQMGQTSPQPPHLNYAGLNQLQMQAQTPSPQPLQTTYTGQSAQSLRPPMNGYPSAQNALPFQSQSHFQQPQAPAAPPKPSRPSLLGYKPSELPPPPPRPQTQTINSWKPKPSWFGRPASEKPPKPMQTAPVQRPPLYGSPQQQQQSMQQMQMQGGLPPPLQQQQMQPPYRPPQGQNQQNDVPQNETSQQQTMQQQQQAMQQQLQQQQQQNLQLQQQLEQQLQQQQAQAQQQQVQLQQQLLQQQTQTNQQAAQQMQELLKQQQEQERLQAQQLQQMLQQQEQQEQQQAQQLQQVLQQQQEQQQQEQLQQQLLQQQNQANQQAAQQMQELLRQQQEQERLQAQQLQQILQQQQQQQEQQQAQQLQQMMQQNQEQESAQTQELLQQVQQQQQLEQQMQQQFLDQSLQMQQAQFTAAYSQLGNSGVDGGLDLSNMQSGMGLGVGQEQTGQNQSAGDSLASTAGSFLGSFFGVNNAAASTSDPISSGLGSIFGALAGVNSTGDGDVTGLDGGDVYTSLISATLSSGAAAAAVAASMSSTPGSGLGTGSTGGSAAYNTILQNALNGGANAAAGPGVGTYTGSLDPNEALAALQIQYELEAQGRQTALELISDSNYDYVTMYDNAAYI